MRWAATAPVGTIPDPEEVTKEKLNFHRRWFKKFEDLLDGTTTGPLWLREEKIAEIIAEALQNRDGKVYRLDAFCVWNQPQNKHIC